jgi:hypothetical protein
MKLKEILRAFLRELLEALIGKEERYEELRLRNLHLFSFPAELDIILAISRRYFPPSAKYPVNPHALILAIREAEKGRKGFEFGVIAVKDTDLETQCAYACATVQKNFERFRESGEQDFIAFLGKRYAPVGAANDPHNLNSHWVSNVRWFYERFRG